MNDPTPTEGDTLEGAYERAEDIFLKLFVDEQRYLTIEPNLLEKSIINFLDKLGQISQKSEKIIVFPLQSLPGKTIERTEILIECLELSIPLVDGDPFSLTAIDNAIKFLNGLSREDKEP